MRYKYGFVCGAFDLIHPGYIRLFREAKSMCDHLVVGLHMDPSKERPDKFKPVQSVSDRIEILIALGVDIVIPYATEEELLGLLTNLQERNLVHVRFLGTDYIDRPYTGSELGIHIHYHDRSDEHSYSLLRRRCLGEEKIN